MAKLTLQSLRIEVSAIIEKELAANTLNKIANDMAEQLFTNNIDRLAKGIDTQGRKIPQLTPDSAYGKRQRIRGLWKSRRPRGEYAAKSTPNYGRDSGFTLRNIEVEVKWQKLKNKIRFKINMFTKDGNVEDIIGFLKEKGRDYYGGLASLTSGTGKKELEKLTKIFEDKTRLKATSKVI